MDGSGTCFSSSTRSPGWEVIEVDMTKDLKIIAIERAMSLTEDLECSVKVIHLDLVAARAAALDGRDSLADEILQSVQLRLRALRGMA